MDVSAAPTPSLFGFDDPICPYTGLRTFTEHEAIYFRGRESHIAKCLALLVEQRFVMITGASGDGKSSLVFAGMLPAVRAGFVPARHGRWAVATFRPERHPLHNLAQALTTALRLPSPEAVAAELSQGFSSLVELYQASELGQPALPTENLTLAQRQQQRQAANLLLVVDQFEEFFTNPENYDGDQPNTAAQTTVSLLLETVRLAQAQGLPIYIVCTMRSDFVGQCAEFRGLIEQVGASQYFVPRLLRQEFKEVIEGPAALSGNRISERLVQRLLYDIGQGQDQLPVLQHALRRIWLAADHGREEMDLLHYAMVGGLADVLPPEDQARFAAWRAALPAHQQQFLLGSPALRNVLDAHANQLYYEAHNRYNRDFQPPLPPGTAERVIEQTFRVLTRTDGKRVVRNRVTGAEITAILDDPALPWPVVCRILRPFREEGTTFLSPFLREGDDGRTVLPAEAVLDISHESLIRNWGKLAEWAQLEAKDVRIANDFKQQAGRWHESGESKGYLLPIGLYNFFSGWYNSKKGADGWLAYYQNANPDAALGAGPLATLTHYLAASRRHLWSELLAAHYGVWRLVAAILLPLVLLAGGWWWWALRVQQSDYVAGRLVERGLDEMLKITLHASKSKEDRPKVQALMERSQNQQYNDSLTAKERERGRVLYDSCYEVLQKQVPAISANDAAGFMLNVHRLKDVIYNPWFSARQTTDYAFPQMLNALQDDTLALNVELSMYASVSNTDYDLVEPENPLVQPILRDLVSRLAQAGTAAPAAKKGNAPITQKQRRVAVLLARTVMALSHYLASDLLYRVRVALPPPVDPAPHRPARQNFRNQRKQLLRKLRDYVQQEIRTTAGPAPGTEAFELCLRVLLGQGTDTPEDLNFLTGVSPLSPKSAPQFERLLNNLGEGANMSAKRGYLTAAVVFAALQRPDMVYRCVDTVRHYNCTALLPYLVKYGVLSANNTHQLLAKIAQTSRVSFNEVYAATAYSLLSAEPGKAVFEESETAAAATPGTATSAGYSPPDLVSFSLPVPVRDKAWAALTGATPETARQEPLFADQNADYQTAVQADYRSKRNELFLTAFLTKIHGVYLAEIKQQPLAGAQSFAAFSTILNSLQQQMAKSKSAQRLDYSQWKMVAPKIQEAEEQHKGLQNPITFLRLPTRPRTALLGNYYTCSFDSFFLYELQHEALAAKPDLAVVRLLDSLAFQEVLVADRFSDSSSTVFAGFNAVNHSARYLPNLVWIKAIANTNIPADSTRQQGNALLASIEVALQDRKKLRDSVFTRRLLRASMSGLSAIPGINSIKLFSWIPLTVAFSDLATALAHEGQIADAFELVEFMEHEINYGFAGSMLSPATRIRVCEQAMLTNNQSAHGLVDSFLLKYLADNQAGAITVDPKNPPTVSANILTVCFWRPIATEKTDEIPLLAQSLTYRLNNQQLVAGLYAPFKAYGLADNLYKANEEVVNSPFRAGVTPFRNITYALLGYAHLTTPKPDADWREYDEAALIRPADYLGFASCNN